VTGNTDILSIRNFYSCFKHFLVLIKYKKNTVHLSMNYNIATVEKLCQQ